MVLVSVHSRVAYASLMEGVVIFFEGIRVRLVSCALLVVLPECVPQKLTCFLWVYGMKLRANSWEFCMRLCE